MATRTNGGAAVVVCAWCAHFRRPTAAVRPAACRHWVPISHAAVRALQRADLASSGLCPACRPLLAREWGLPAAAAHRRRHQAA